MTENNENEPGRTKRRVVTAAWSAFRAWVISPVTLAVVVAAVAAISIWIVVSPSPDRNDVTMLEHSFVVDGCRVEAVGDDGAIWVRPVGGTGELHRMADAADC